MEILIKKTAKGIKKSTLENITFNAYKESLEKSTLLRHPQYNIISKNHNLKTVYQNKVSLTAYYDKKYLLNNIYSNSYWSF